SVIHSPRSTDMGIPLADSETFPQRIPPSSPATAPPAPSSSVASISGTKANRRRRLWLALLFCVAVVSAVAGVSWWRTRGNAQMIYVTAPAERGVVMRTVTATGTVNPVLNIIVGTYVSGVIQDLYCDFNTRVTKGQLCAKIDPRPYQTIVDQDRANVAAAKAQLLKDQASLTYAELTFTRQQSLLQSGITSQEAFDNARSLRDALKAQVALDQASILQRQAELESAEVNLAYTDIRSPVDGMVIQRNITIGQTVAASFQTPTLFLIATDLTNMQVDTNVSESDLAYLAEGRPATFTVESFPNRVFRGTVVQVRQAPQSIQNVITYDVVVGIRNPDLALKPGMTATVRIITGEQSDVLRVSNQALRYLPQGEKRPSTAEETQHQQRSLWVLRNGAPQHIVIQPGLEGDNYTEVKSGELHEKDAVIVGEQPRKRNSKSALPTPRL
ncbi:MAG TPA: efflux RND transporter periplasmic adaptor subunit, partial [Edaphobacter sp.]|nr:efflux RND transporter periplasmic adaptor subunit [Edaphobacter sp.]